MRVLIVEDDLLIQKTVELKLKKEGFEVICCSDGKAALDQVETKPDIVLTDIMLPFFSGLEIVRAVKSIPDKKIPVVVFSTMGQEAIVEEAFLLGADDFIKKPFSLTELAMRIKRFAPDVPL
jgi:DNA-binding response OmpR family regulator